MPKIWPGVTHSIAAILDSLNPVHLRHARQKFKAFLKELPSVSKSLSSRPVKNTLKPAEMSAKASLNLIDDVVNFLDNIKKQIKPSNGDEFKARVRIFLHQHYGKEELGEIVKKAELLKENADWFKLDDRHALVLEVMHEQYQRLEALRAPRVENGEALRAAQDLFRDLLATANKPEQVKELIRTLAQRVEGKLSKDEQMNDSRFELGVKTELMRLGLDRAALDKFVDNAKGIKLDRHSEIVLKVMDEFARTTPSEWFAAKK
jgi:hypothetical protein